MNPAALGSDGSTLTPRMQERDAACAPNGVRPVTLASSTIRMAFHVARVTEAGPPYLADEYPKQIEACRGGGTQTEQG